PDLHIATHSQRGLPLFRERIRRIDFAEHPRFARSVGKELHAPSWPNARKPDQLAHARCPTGLTAPHELPVNHLVPRGSPPHNVDAPHLRVRWVEAQLRERDPDFRSPAR